MRKWIVVAAFGAAVAACAAGAHTLTKEEQNTADLGGIKFAQGLGADFVGCSGIDSEPDGYVTCTFKDRATAKTSQGVCSYQSGAAGCKMK